VIADGDGLSVSTSNGSHVTNTELIPVAAPFRGVTPCATPPGGAVTTPRHPTVVPAPAPVTLAAHRDGRSARRSSDGQTFASGRRLSGVVPALTESVDRP
jgi:hypothetical protein